MQEFIAIDFETANPKRVSACSLGYAVVSNCQIVETNSYLIKPVGGHAPFQSKIHGIKEEHTIDKPMFGELFPDIKSIFDYPLVAHSLFDKQVLNALSDYFDLGLNFTYFDSCSLAKENLSDPDIKNYKLKTLVKYFNLPEFRHHDSLEDAIACANVFIRLSNSSVESISKFYDNNILEFKGLINGILADDEVNYKEAYELIYWLEDNKYIAKRYEKLYMKIKAFLADDYLDKRESSEMKDLLERIIKDL